MALDYGDESDSTCSSSAIPSELRSRQRRRTKLRPVFPRFDWMIIPNTLAYIMSWYGLFVGKFPVQVLSAVVGLAIIFTAGLHRIQIADLRPEDYLPTDSRSTIERTLTTMFDYNDPRDPSENPTVQIPRSTKTRRINRRPRPTATTPSPTKTTLITGKERITTQFSDDEHKITVTETPRFDNSSLFHSKTAKSARLNRHKRDNYLDPQGRYQSCRISSVLIVAKRNVSDKSGKSYNLFTPEMLREVERLEATIFSAGVEVVSPKSGDGGFFFYESEPGEDNGVCTQQPTGECGGFNLRVMRALFPTDSVRDPLALVFSSLPGVALTYPHYMSYDLSQFFGRVETVDNKHNGRVKHIGAIREVYCVNEYQANWFKRAFRVWLAWEKKFDSTVREFKSKYFNVYWTAEYQKQAEQDYLIKDMLPKVGVTFCALMLWCTVGALMNDAVRSKPWAGIVGVFATLTGCVSGFGICLWITPRFWPIIMAVPLLTLAIGLDDMFILLEAWSHTNPSLPVEERIMLSMNVGGTSIVITFFINMLDFVIGNYTPYPLIQALSAYAIATMVLDFFFQMTIFCAGISLFGSGEEKNRHACCCCLSLPTRSELLNQTPTTNSFSLLCCAGGLPRDSAERMRRAAQEEDYLEAGHFQEKITTTISHGLTRLPFRIFAIFGFFLYLALSIWSITKLELGLKAERIFRESSNLHDYTYYHRILFTAYSNEVLVVVNNPVDYWKPEIQRKFSDFVDKVRESGYFWGDEETKCWIVEFMQWAKDSDVNLTSVQSNAELIKLLRRHPDGFLASHDTKTFLSNKQFAKDIRISPNHTVIRKSRFRLRARNMTGPERQIGMMTTIRKLADRYRPEIHMLAYTGDFQMYDQFLTAVPATLYYCGMTLGCTFVVALFMIPHPACLFWVAVFVTSVLIGIIGQMRLWDMDLDSISLINLLIAISFCSDLIAHPVYIFLITPVPKTTKSGQAIYAPEARLIKARALIEEVASAAVPACVGTTLSVIAMSTSDAYIFLAFFRIMFLSVVLSVFHGLVFVPAFLTFIGPSSSGLQTGQTREHDRSDVASPPTEIEDDFEVMTSTLSEVGAASSASNLVEVASNDGPIVFKAAADRAPKKRGGARLVVVQAPKPRTTHQHTQTDKQTIMGFLPHRPSAAHGGAGLRMFYGPRRVWDMHIERQYRFDSNNRLTLDENTGNNDQDDFHNEDYYLPATIRPVPIPANQYRDRGTSHHRSDGHRHRRRRGADAQARTSGANNPARLIQQRQQSQVVASSSFPDVQPLASLLTNRGRAGGAGGAGGNNTVSTLSTETLSRSNTLNRSRHGVEMLPAKHRFNI